jgi:SAM-dependent methyltransferase
MGEGMAGSLTNPDEPLAESAPIAWSLAPALCAGDPASRDSCLWYHRIWQYLRLLDIITSIRTNTPFLLATLARLAPTHPRVLISGSADYAMLAHLREAFGAHPLDVTIVDRCATSVRINQWYADRYGVGLTPIRGDALAVDTDRPFDLVCTHNFVGRFDRDARQRLVDRWHAVLRPGGVVVTTQRVRPGDRSRMSSYSDDEARALAARVAAAAADYRGTLGATPEDLREVAYQYALRKGTYVIESPSEIVAPFEQAGFEVNLADQGGGLAERQADRPSSTAGLDTFRMRLIATRTGH